MSLLSYAISPSGGNFSSINSEEIKGCGALQAFVPEQSSDTYEKLLEISKRLLEKGLDMDRRYCNKTHEEEYRDAVNNFCEETNLLGHRINQAILTPEQKGELRNKLSIIGLSYAPPLNHNSESWERMLLV